MNEADPGLLSCIDYLMAASEYQDFVVLMLDMRGGYDYELDDNLGYITADVQPDAIAEEAEEGEGAEEEQK